MNDLVTQTVLSHNLKNQLGLQTVPDAVLINAFGKLLMAESNPPNIPIAGSRSARLSNQGVTSTTFDFEYFGETFRNLNVRKYILISYSY